MPYGGYDVGANTGWVSVGITTIRLSSPWLRFAAGSPDGAPTLPGMRELTITADCGGLYGPRVRLWKVELQKLADETGLTLHSALSAGHIEVEQD